MDYINRDAAIKLFTFATCDGLGFEPTIHAYEVVDGLKSLPSADVAPVVHGKWIEWDDVRVRCSCSVCNHEFHIMEDDVFGYPYCPNCGAKMDISEADDQSPFDNE